MCLVSFSTCIDSSILHKSKVTQVLRLALFYRWAIKAQRGQVTSPRSHSSKWWSRDLNPGTRA